MKFDIREFSSFLKRNGRSDSATKRAVKLIEEYETFLRGRGAELNEANIQDLEDFVTHIEQDKRSSAKTYLWAARYYYQFAGVEELANLAGALREERIDRKPFPLKDFRGVDPVHIERLAAKGIKNIRQMLKFGATPEDRQNLSERTGVPLESILDLVKLSDLARIRGIKGVRARLYVDAGIDSIEKMAQMEPKALREVAIDFVDRTGFDGIPTLPKEAKSAVRKAKQLPIIVKY